MSLSIAARLRFMTGLFAALALQVGLLVAFLLAIAPAPARAAALDNIRQSVQEFTLDNGLRILVVERHDAPVFAYATVVDAGSVCEMTGTTGIAHMFEHMSLKGTPTIGTTDYAKESKALDAVDAAWDAVRSELDRGADTDSVRLGELMARFMQAREAAQKFVIPNAYDNILETNGGRDMNAQTRTDMTAFYYRLPSNRLELWGRLEGDRLSHPVLREFYTERDVVRNERRMQESSPIGRLFNNLLTTAFEAHPYGNGVIGFSSDIENFRRRDAIDFYDKYYVASNMTICLVGDVTMDDVRRVAGEYFEDMRQGPNPPPVITQEPVHTAERRVIAEEDANPVLLAGWQAPAERERDFAAMELLMDILGNGRTSRLYERLVKKEQIATQVGAGVGLPGSKYPNLAGAFIYVTADKDPLLAEQMAYEEIKRLSDQGPTAEELAKVKTRYRANHIRALRRPDNLALELAAADQIAGHWSWLFEQIDRIDAVTVADVQRVAAERLIPGRRAVAVITRPPAADEAE